MSVSIHIQMDDKNIRPPLHYEAILEKSQTINFTMPSELHTGSLLRTLIASKPGGRFLELGTGTGLALSWIVESADRNSSIVSIDNNEEYTAVAKSFFADDPRVTILCEDGNDWILNYNAAPFDLIFADTWAGKYQLLHEALSLLKIGGFYVVDDMSKQPNWPDGHELKAIHLVEQLSSRSDITLTKLNWSTGVIVACKIL